MDPDLPFTDPLDGLSSFPGKGVRRGGRRVIKGRKGGRRAESARDMVAAASSGESVGIPPSTLHGIYWTEPVRQKKNKIRNKERFYNTYLFG